MCLSIVIRSVAVYIICGLFVNKTLQIGLLVLLVSLGNGGTIPKGDPDKFNPVIVVIVLSQLFLLLAQFIADCHKIDCNVAWKKVVLYCEVSQIYCKNVANVKFQFQILSQILSSKLWNGSSNSVEFVFQVVNVVTNFVLKICEIFVQIALNLDCPSWKFCHKFCP